MFKEIRNLFSFLTILSKMDEDWLVDSAKLMFVFPLVGAFLGFLAGLLGWLLSLLLPSLIVGGLVLGVLLLLTGLHHTDGLLDFGDGIMAHGTPERKVEVMHDQLTGAGGLSLGILTFLVTALCIGSLDSSFATWNIPIILSGLVVVEVSAKLSMVVGAWAGKAAPSGMSVSFLAAMHGRKGDAALVAAIAISLGIAVPLLWVAGAFLILVSVLVGLIMAEISHRHFNYMTGDVLGATNELSRMVAFIALLAVIGWA
jgi:adenosylcobinamide-GDP ribazoletransferase